MSNNDAAPVQCIANGTTDGNHNGPTTIATGAILRAMGVGDYVVTLDPGLPGDVACDPDASRIFVQLFGAGIIAQVIKSPAPFTTFQVLTTVAQTGAPADSGFDFIVFKAANVP